MEEYAFSQAFEQIFRVGFLLSAACLIVYGLHIERRWALYTSVLDLCSSSCWNSTNHAL